MIVYAHGGVTLHQGHVIDVLRSLPAQSVHCVATSPPFYGLRNYKTALQVWGGDANHTHVWGAERTRQKGGTSQNKGLTNPVNSGTRQARDVDAQTVQHGAMCSCGAWRGELGGEPTPDLYAAHLVSIFAEVHRVLRDDGVCWINLGDGYANDGKWGGSTSGKHVDGLHGEPVGRARRYTGLKPKDLIGTPWLVAFALRAAGWWLRQEIIWAKGVSFSPGWAGAIMPESITDRCTRSHETIFMLTKSPRYYYDHEAIKEAAIHGDALTAAAERPRVDKEYQHDSASRMGKRSANRMWSDPEALLRAAAGRNARSVWCIGTEPSPDPHFAQWPTMLVQKMILAGTSAHGVCGTCGAPWARQTSRVTRYAGSSAKAGRDVETIGKKIKAGIGRTGKALAGGPVSSSTTTGWVPTCACPATTPLARAVVLDPFAGTATSCWTARMLGRTAIGIELSVAYCGIAIQRLSTVDPGARPRGPVPTGFFA